MQLSTPERLTGQFYDWEQRGRGWAVYPVAVDLEPPFYPFFGHFSSTAPFETADDSVRHTIASGAVALLRKAFKKKPPPQPEYEDDVILPIEFDCDEQLRAFSIVLPKGTPVKVEEAEQLLTMLSYTAWPLSFEILANSEHISYQLVCRETDIPQVNSQVKAFFPDCIIKEHPRGLDRIAGNAVYQSVIDYGLSDEFMRPLAAQKNFNLDPFIGLCAAFEALRQGEFTAIQILFKGTVNPWTESIMRAVLDNGGGDFFENAPDMVPLAKEKVAAPLFGVTIKVIGEGATGEGAVQIALHIGKALCKIFSSKGNSLIPLGGDYRMADKADDLLLRQSCRQGMLLNCKELATIVHLPSENVTSPKVIRNARKTKPASAFTHDHALILGANEHGGSTRKVSVSTEQRLKHTHIIGATGTGKSTMLQSMIVQDMRQGNGIAVLDPHGDLIEGLLAHVPEKRLPDVILFDPSDAEYPVGFNILSAHSEIEKEILASDLVAVFKRLSTSWGDQMNSVLANAILAFLESTRGGTLFELRRFLLEKSFREDYLQSVADPSVIYYWQKEFPLLKSSSIGSILTRLDTFLRPKLIRNMVAQKKGLDFEKILDGKILLVKLSQGLIGIENSYLLGTFFITKFYQAATSRQAKSIEARRDFFVYVDEFQNFITPSMSAILSGARKYRMGLVLAHQEMQQLVKYDSELAASVIANAGTRVCFRLADTDARRFAAGFSFFEQQDLENLNTGEAIARIERPDYDFSLTTIPIRAEEDEEGRRQAVIQSSREAYGTPRHEVEILFADLNAATAQANESDKPKQQGAAKQVSGNVQRDDSIKPAPVTAAESVEAAAPLLTRSLIKKKGETEHRYLQTFIKKMAEARGYKATIEAPTPNGNGRVDVSLERNGARIACEICVTTEKEWELHNTQKCLAAGYDVVINISRDRKTLDGIRKLVEASLEASLQSRVLQFEPEQLFTYLDEALAKEASTEKRFKGYRVKVDYNVGSSEESERKKASVGKTILSARKNKKTE